ncbi:MAG: PD-(D/E)XK nuclease family protein [Aureliella sp.]
MEDFADFHSESIEEGASTQIRPSSGNSKSNRCFLGWDKPVLRVAVDKLYDDFAVASDAVTGAATWDMRNLLVVMPSSLACRRLAELLALKAESEGRVHYPPKIVTVGNLPEELYHPEFAVASPAVQQFAWLKALYRVPKDELLKFIPNVPAKQSTNQWLDLAKVVSGLHRELSSEQLDFSQVADYLSNEMADGDGFPHPEHSRWAVLARIQSSYLEILQEMHLCDLQTARIRALNDAQCQSSRQIISIGCVDLSRIQKAMLAAIGGEVLIWVAAPQSESEYFDAWGCLVAERWQTRTLDIPAENLYVGGTPRDQANLTASCLADFQGQYHQKEITVGVPEPKLIPEIRRRLSLSDVATRYGPGHPLSQSEPISLIRMIGEYLRTKTYESFAALVRHPVVDEFLSRQHTTIPASWLQDLDEYYQEALPKRIDKFVHTKAIGAESYAAVTKVITKWLHPISRQQLPLVDFVQPLLTVLSTVYGRQVCSLDEPAESELFSAARRSAEALLELRDVPKEIQPRMAASEMITWLVDSLSGQLVPEVPDADSVELLGWLELAWDDAPALVVTGLHDGVVPESSNSDSFLPNAFRKRLGIMDNLRRLARDVYATQLLLTSKSDVRFIVGRTDESGDPLTPSRVLMACPLEQLPSRVMHLVSETANDSLAEVRSRWNKPAVSTLQPLQRPAIDPDFIQANRPRYITVTAFREYLACPYRFYLKHIRRLRSKDDSVAELGASQFGVLVHDALAELKGNIGECDSPEIVEAFLLEKLHRFAAERYGDSPAAAVLIQIEQAELRLKAFAAKQAARAAEGWKIVHVEVGTDAKDHLKIGTSDELNLVGRIDRIDHQPHTGRWAIWDYKTSETAKNPVTVHWTESKGWQDLQLPLYRSIARRLGVDSEPTLGYITLPKSASDGGFTLAEFTHEQLAEADSLAAEIATQVASGDFGDGLPRDVLFDDFSRICQTQVQEVESSRSPVIESRFAEDQLVAAEPAQIEKAEQLAVAPVVVSPKLEPLLIRASAGTGKTFQLSNRLLAILLAGQPADTILATTFTRKAAGEILSRVLERLADACLSETARSELASHLEDVDTSLENCLATLRRVTRSIHRLRIGTLDSFFAQVARSFGMELQLPNAWQAMDPADEPRFQMQAIGQLLESQERKTLVDLVRMLAKGESSRRVAEEIRYTVQAGLSAYRVTGEEAWDQIPIPASPSEKAVDSAVQTLEQTRLAHKSADKQMVNLHLWASTGDWEKLISHKIYSAIQNQEPTYFNRELPNSLVAALEVLAERAAAELLPIRRGQTRASYQVIKAYAEQHNALVQSQRKLSFSDVTYYLAEWLNPISKSKGDRTKGSSKRREVAGLLVRRLLDFRLDCSIEHLLLDEFQDTAVEQWRILEPIAQPLANDCDDETQSRSIFCVGDTKQAIYGWRGGVAEIFDTVTTSMPGIHQHELSKSYRSSSTIMETVNQVFQHLEKHSNFADCDPIAHRWSDQFPEHQTARETLNGYVRVVNGPDPEGLSADEYRAEQLKACVGTIKNVAQSSSASVGVLLRTNRDVGIMMGLLRAAGVPASQDGGNPLTDCAAVELLLSLLHLADHPGDTNSHFHVANSPLADILPVDHSDAKKVSHWVREQASRRGLGELLGELATPLAVQLSWWDQFRLEQFITLASQFQLSSSLRLRDFEQLVEQQRVALPSEAQVKVMTVHKSKGLEFDAVFLPDLSSELQDGNTLLVMRGKDPVAPPDGVVRYMNSALQQLLPQSWQDAFLQLKGRKVIESLCLLYVAMTRARQALYITTVPKKHRTTQTFGAVIQSTLCDKEASKQPDAVLAEFGQPDWYLGIGDMVASAIHSLDPVDTSADQQNTTADTAAESAPDRIIRFDHESDRVASRGLRISAPSHSALIKEPQPISNLFTVSENVGTAYGKLIHKFFEQIEWIEDFKINRKDLQTLAQTTLSAEELQRVSVKQAISDFEDLLELENTRHVLSQQRYSLVWPEGDSDVNQHIEVDNERELSLKLNDDIIVGSIDRLVVTYREGRPYSAEIIDFKTDRFDPAMNLLWLDERTEVHRPQLEAYRDAVAYLYKIPTERISTFLLMFATDELVPLESMNTSQQDLPAGATAS